MSKLGRNGKPIYNEKGKVMKGPKYFKPDLKSLLRDERQLSLGITWNSRRYFIYMVDKYLF